MAIPIRWQGFDMKVLERIADVLAATMVIMVGIAMGAIIVALLTLAYLRFIDGNLVVSFGFLFGAVLTAWIMAMGADGID